MTVEVEIRGEEKEPCYDGAPENDDARHEEVADLLGDFAPYPQQWVRR